jgi:acetoin utilization deacetylase AcuC-like enzyme
LPSTEPSPRERSVFADPAGGVEGVFGSGLREIRRRWRCLARRFGTNDVRWLWSSQYEHFARGVPIDPKRSERVLAALSAEGLLHRADLVEPRPASMRNLLRVHHPDYLQSLERREALVRIFGVAAPDDEAEQVVRLQRLQTGGTIQASRLARHERAVAVNLGGGFHHAYRDSGLAFCVFNDIAVAIARLRSRGFRDRVLVVDVDLHDGNGTRAVFANDPTVHTYSVHNDHWGETEVVQSTSIALGPDVGDEVYLGTLLKTLPPVAEAFDPGMVFVVAGTDPAHDDPLGNWNISDQGMLSRDRFILELFRGRGRRMPMVIVLGGGYGDRTWQHTARSLSWYISGRAIEPPDNEALTMAHFRRIREMVDPARFTSDGGEFTWSLTDEDLAGILPGVPRRTRFLDFFSNHGIELALEQFGLLDQLRLRGFIHPVVDVDFGHTVGQTLRIHASAERTELLVELRADRSQRVAPDFEVLVIEWLLLQNPRAEFGPFRRPLPGQKHPGLGLLKEFFSFLVVVCEMIGLDGVYYVPSSYHVAAQSRSKVCFVKPEHEAEFAALSEAMAGVPLARASTLVAEGGVTRKEDGAVYEWRGLPMVLPVSKALEETVRGDAYRAAVVEARSGFAFEIRREE